MYPLYKSFYKDLLRASLLLLLLNPMALATEVADDCPDSYQLPYRLSVDGESSTSALRLCRAQELSHKIDLAGTGTSISFQDYGALVRDHTPFYGLASYYSAVRVLVFDGEDIFKLEQSESAVLGEGAWLAIVGRFNVLFIAADDAKVSLEETLNLAWEPGSSGGVEIILLDKASLPDRRPGYDAVRYSHLWNWLAALSRLVEWSLVAINTHIISNWGWSVVVFAVALKLLLLPVGVMTVRLQRSVGKNQALLAPRLAEIKAMYDNEQAHERIMAAHKELGITPFFTLKPMLGSLIQIPILVAVFNALGEMSQFNNASFLWITNLAYADTVASLPFVVPFMGDRVSLLPFLMTVITVFSTVIFQNSQAPAAELKRQKINLYLMALAFFVLFYPFPAVMVLYWALTNLLQFVQQQLVKI